MDDIKRYHDTAKQEVKFMNRRPSLVLLGINFKGPQLM